MWTSIAGAVLGGVVGGPIGAAIGAGLGYAMSESQGGEGGRSLDADLTWAEQGEGVLLSVETDDVESGQILLLLLHHPDGVDLVDRMASDDMPAGLRAFRRMGGQHFVLWLPFGGLEGVDQVRPELWVVDEAAEGPVASVTFEPLPWKRASLVLAEFYRPLIGLCMAVARADGTLERSEVRAIRRVLGKGLGIPESEDEHLKGVLKSEPSLPVDQLLDQVLTRLPAMEPQGILSILAEVAHADGRLHPEEVALIRRVALSLGCEASEWEAVARDLGFGSFLKADGWRSLLDVGPDATAKQIRDAYRTKMKAYHPDKYASLPPEFQRVAEEMSRQLVEARDGLLGLTT